MGFDSTEGKSGLFVFSKINRAPPSATIRPQWVRGRYDVRVSSARTAILAVPSVAPSVASTTTTDSVKYEIESCEWLSNSSKGHTSVRQARQEWNGLFQGTPG